MLVPGSRVGVRLLIETPPDENVKSPVPTVFVSIDWFAVGTRPTSMYGVATCVVSDVKASAATVGFGTVLPVPSTNAHALAIGVSVTPVTVPVPTVQ